MEWQHLALGHWNLSGNCRHCMPSTWVHFLAAVAAADSLGNCLSSCPVSLLAVLVWAAHENSKAQPADGFCPSAVCLHLTSDSVKPDYTAPPWIMSNMCFGVCQEQQTCFTFSMSQWCLPFSKYLSKPNSNCSSVSQKKWCAYWLKGQDDVGRNKRHLSQSQVHIQSSQHKTFYSPQEALDEAH